MTIATSLEKPDPGTTSSQVVLAFQVFLFLDPNGLNLIKFLDVDATKKENP